MAAMRARLVFVLFCVITTSRGSLPTGKDYWHSLTKNELQEALKIQWNTGKAKNVILFIGDGMGPNTVTATRIYKGGESHRLTYEKFPHVGLLKTYSADKMVPDSSCSATALLCGVKANQRTIGVDASVKAGDCEASLVPEARLDSLAAVALRANRSAGLVTNMRVTHATPAPVYAHSAERNWECEARMPANSKCKDIARQLVEDWPGADLNVILGGGYQMLVSNATGSDADPIDTWSCYSTDGRNLINKYIEDKRNRGLKYTVARKNSDLRSLDVENTDYLLGIFANGHIKYEFERDKGPDGQPSLAEMTEAAIKVLSKNERGYFLMVEGGQIDMAHHRGRAKTAIDEAAAMEAAVSLALSMVDTKDTLVIVTSDHTHTLSINGYPYRGSDVFGLTPNSPYDNTNYTVLSYGTGGPGSFHFYATTENNETVVKRKDASEQDTSSFYYEQVAGIRLDENSHGGGDVAVYAKGPYAHLFHNVHEQHYVFSVITYAADFNGENVGISAHPKELYLLIALLGFLCLVR